MAENENVIPFASSPGTYQDGYSDGYRDGRAENLVEAIHDLRSLVITERKRAVEFLTENRNFMARLERRLAKVEGTKTKPTKENPTSSKLPDRPPSIAAVMGMAARKPDPLNIKRSLLGSKWDHHDTFKVEDLAEILSISRDVAYAAVRSGKIGSIRFGKRYVIPRVIIEDLLG